MVTQEEMDFIKNLIKEKSEEIKEYISFKIEYEFIASCEQGEFENDIRSYDRVESDYIVYRHDKGIRSFLSLESAIHHIKNIKPKPTMKSSVMIQQEKAAEECLAKIAQQEQEDD